MTELRLIARQIKSRVTVSEAASWYGYDYREGDRNECPKCSTVSTSRKTLALYDDESWYCFHCAEGGDVIDWLAAQQRTTKGDAIMRLASRLGISGDMSELIRYLKERMTPAVKAALAEEARNEKHAREIRRHFYAYRRKSTLIDDSEYIRTVQIFLDLESHARNGEKPAEAINAAKRIAEGSSIDLSQFSLRAKCYAYTRALAEWYAKRTPAQAIDRFGPAACELFGIGSAPASHAIPKKHLAMARDLGLLGKKSDRPLARGRMIFPIRDLIGRTVAFGSRRLNEDDGPKYINSGESIIFEKRRSLYGLHEAAPFILKRGFAVILEGYGDVVSFHRFGIRNAVAPLGTSLTEEQAELLGRFAPFAVTMFDGDKAGRKAAKRADLTLRVARVRAGHVRLSNEDPEEAIGRIKAAGIARLIRAARPDPRPEPGEDPLGVIDFRRRVR